MITAPDFLTLPYTPDLTQAGIAYACKSLPYTYDRMGGNLYQRLRRIVAGVAVELAFIRHLNERAIPHDLCGATPFTDPDRYDIAIGGRRCDLKSYMLTKKERISQIRKKPQALLEAQALVPADQTASDHLADDDLYIFAFLNALVTPDPGALALALGAGQPACLIHALPNTWSRPREWSGLGKLALKCDTSGPVTVELGGQNRERKFQTETITLNPRVRTEARGEFHTLGYLHAPGLPDGPVGIHSPILQETRLVDPGEWENIWVYGLEIRFTGYLPRGEFRARSVRLPAGSRVFQYQRTRTENYALPIRELRPFGELFERARSWANTPK